VDAKCAHHPDAVADGGTCERCGTYICAACAVAGSAPAICRPCLRLLSSGRHIKHARVLSILMMVHGGLLLATGAYYVLFGGFMFDAMMDIPVGDDADELAEQLPGMLMGMFTFIGLSHVLPGVLQGLAGWMLLRHRGIRLAWAAAAMGLLSLFGCYCSPTALALAAYAVFVLTRDDVKARFAVVLPPAS